MKCKENNSRGAPCGNDAIEGESYCQAHLKRRTNWYRRLSNPLIWVPVLITVIGFLADIMGIWSFRSDWSNQTKLLAGIEFIEGGLKSDAECNVGFCGQESAGVTFDNEFEPVFHMVAGPDAGECLALGFSLFNDSDFLVRNVRAQITLKSEAGGALEFCNEFDIEANSTYPGVEVKRKFAQQRAVSIASYSIDEIAPGNVGFFTLPIRNNPNLLLVSNGKHFSLVGTPTTLTVKHSADGSSNGEISAFLYLSEMVDKAQGLSDHFLLLGHHTGYSDAIFNDETSKFLNNVKSWLSSRPDYTEYVIGAYDSNSQLGLGPSYSVPVEPITKQVVTVRQQPTIDLGRMEIDRYLAFKDHICSTAVRNVEGETYACEGMPIVLSD